MSACSPATRGCAGSVVTTVLRTTGGTAPVPLARVEVYEGGCLRYESSRARRCVCPTSTALRETLAPEAAEAAVTALRIAPRTLYDAEGVGIGHRGVTAGRANADLPRAVREWLAAIDEGLRAEIGRSYEPLLGAR